MAKSLSELKPKPVIVEPPKPAAAPPTAPLPEPAVSAEIETTEAPKPKKPAATVPAAAPAAVPAAAPTAAKSPVPADVPAPVVPVRSTDILHATGGTRIVTPTTAPGESTTKPAGALQDADYADPMQYFADQVGMPLSEVQSRVTDFSRDPRSKGLSKDAWQREVVKYVVRDHPQYNEIVGESEQEPSPSLPTYGFSQGDGHVLWAALRTEWEKENYRGEKAKAPEQVFSDFAAARGMTVDELRASAAAAGTDLEKIREVAQRKQNRADSLQDFNRLQLGGRYATPEKARQAAVAEATTPAATEDDSYSLVVRQSPTTDLITDTPEEDLEVTHTTAGTAHAQAIVDRIDPERLVRFQQGFSRYAQDSSKIFAEAAADILRKHGVIFDVVGPDGEKHKIRMFADNALAAKGAMKDAGIDFGEQQDAVAAKVANEAFRRATARAINEAAAADTLGYFANPIRARISFSQLAGLARPGAFDPMKDDSPLFTIGAPIVDARARVERGEYVDAAAQALAPITQIVGFAEIPGRTNHWPVLIREAAAIETAGDWTDTPYAALRAHFQPAIDAMEAGDRAGAAKQLALNLVSFGYAKLNKDGNIVARSPEEIYADTLASIEQRQTVFEDVSQSELLETALKKAMFLSWAAQKAGVAPPDRYNLDYNNDGKIDAEDEKAGWREAEDDVAFGIQNLTAFGAAVVTLDALDAMAAIHASRLMQAAIRATEFKPRAITLLDDTAKALEAGRFDEAGSLERKIEYRPGHSGEPQGAAVAAPEGNAPELGQVSRITETTLAHEAKVLGKADEMFDEAIEDALPDIPDVVTSPTDKVPRRFYLHGSVRTKNAPVITTEDLRARYDFQHRYNVVKALEDAVAAGTDTYAARLMPRLQKSLDEMLATLKMPEEQVARIRDWWGKAIARGEDISTMLEPALEAQMKGDDLAAAKKASSDFGARLKKEHATAKAEGRIAVERARRAVDQQVKVRIAALRKTAEFARGGDASMFGRWMQEKMPAVRNWFARFRKPKDLIELVDSETLRLAAAADDVTPIDMKAAVKSLDSAEKAVAKQRLALEAAQAAGDEAAEKKVAKLLKAAVTKRDRLVREIAASINGRGHVLSDAGVEHFLQMRAADAGQTAADEIMLTAVLLDVRAEKMVEEGIVKTLEEAHARISWRRSDTVEPDALLQDETPDFIEPERLSRGPRVVRGESGEMVPLPATTESVAAYEQVFEDLANRLAAIDTTGKAVELKYAVQDLMKDLRRRASWARMAPSTLRQSLPVIRRDFDNIRRLDSNVVDAALESLRQVEAKYPIVAPTEPLAVLPPQKVPVDPVEMTRVVRDTPWFHGAVRGEVQLREYDPSKHAGSSAGLMLGPGLYLAENPEVAIRYATAGGGAVGTAPGKAALKTIMVSPERVLDVRPVEGRRYSDVLAERLEAVGLAEDARIVRDSRVNGPYEIGDRWLNRRNDGFVETTAAEQDALETLSGVRLSVLSRKQAENVTRRLGEMTSAEPPMDLIRQIVAAEKELTEVTQPQIDAFFAAYPDLKVVPVEARGAYAAVARRHSRLLEIARKGDALDDTLLTLRLKIGPGGIGRIEDGAPLSDEELTSLWERSYRAKKTLESFIKRARSASSPTQRLLAAGLDGLFHAGSQDGNVLVLFDPNGKIGGRSIITAESRILPERVVYQTDDLADAKAYVQFEADGKALVTLMKKADASSFLHESAHIFRRTLDEKDNATILRWTKAAGLDVELQNGLFVGKDAVKAEEMFARAFERFVMEGKTAVKGLRRLFENLKTVMLRIYRGSKALDVEISPEIEILFNRMLAPKSVATDATPTIHAAVPKTSASKWLAAQSKGLLKAEDILPVLEAGDTVRLPFRVFGKDEINLDDFLRLQLQLDEIAASPNPAFKLPFSEVRQQVVEDTLVGDIQSATSGPVPHDVTAIPFVISKVLATIPFGADAFQKMRVFASRFREMAQSAGRLLNQRVGDMNVFLREARAEDQYLPIIRYMTGERQAFRVGGRQPLSAGHDAVREIGIILEDSHKALKNSVVKVSESIDPQYKAANGVAHYVDANGEVAETVAGAAKVGEMEVELAVLARMITDQPTPALRSRAVNEQLGSRKNQNIVRAVVTAMMTTGGTDDASNTVFRHLGMALLNNGVMEGVSVSNVVRTAKVPHMLAYVDALHRLGGFDVVDNVLVPNNRTSAERLQDFIDVLDRAGFGPEGINRALGVVNTFGAQRSLYTHISGLGAAFTKEQVQSFHRFLNGDVRDAQDYADGLRLFKQFGLNREALEEAAGLLEESSGRYIPASVQRSIDSALSRALDETADKGDTDMTHTAAKWILQVWQRSVVRGSFVPKAAKAWMDVMDTFFMVSAEAGFNSGARAAGRQALQSAFISFQGHLLGRLHLGPSKTDKIRSALQNFSDWMVSPTGQTTVNKVLQGSDELYRTADGRVYRYSDILKVAIRNGTVSSFESSDLRESIRRAQEASKVAGGNVVRRAANDVGRGVRNAGTTVLHANSEIFEAWAERERIGATMTLIEAGMNPEEASRAITRALFDYPGSLAAAETKGTWSGILLTTAQPFWAFTKNSNHYVFNAIERPEVMYRLTRIRRAVEYGQEAVSQTIYSFYVDPYGFDFNEMSPETRASYFHLRYAYEESLGKLPHEMTEEERLTFAAAMMSGSPDNAMQVADGQIFRLPGGEAASLAREVSQLEGGVDIAASYRPEPRRDLLTDYQRKKMTAFFPARRTGMIDGYVRSTQQQDLQYAVAFFEPAPISGMTFLANTLALYAYPPALLSENQQASTAQTSRALEYLVDPERMPLRTQVAAIMQTGQPQQVSPPLAWAIQESGFGAWIYPVSEPINAPSRDFDLAAGMSTDVAGRTKPMRWYAIDPSLNVALQVGLYDINQLGMKVTSGGGAFDRDQKWDILRRVVGVLGPASVTETSQRAAAKKAMYEIPPEAKPR